MAPLKESERLTFTCLSTLQDVILHLLGVEHGFLLSLGQDLQTKFLVGIAVLLDGPVAVLVIKRHPVVLNVFIKFNVANLEIREAGVESIGNPGTE